MDEATLSKLNIPALKAKCKELSLSGYSKLNKPLLVAKLVEYFLTTGGSKPASAPLVESAIPSPLAQPQEAASIQHIPVSRKSTHRSPSPHTVPRQKKARKEASLAVPPRIEADLSLQAKGFMTTDSDASAAPTFDPTPKPIKKKIKKPKEPKSQIVKVLSLNTTAPPSLTPVSFSPEHTLTIDSRPDSNETHIPFASVPTARLISPLKPKAEVMIKAVCATPNSPPPLPSVPVPAPMPQIVSRKFKKFKAPLVPNHASQSKPASPITSTSAPAPAPISVSAPITALVVLDSLLCSPPPTAPTSLTFPVAHLDTYLSTVKPISLPPSYRLRRRIHVLALAFSELGTAERTNVAQTGKLGRYAIYLSAFHHVRRDFPGSLTTALLSHRQVDSSSSNLWPYYRARRAELRARYKLVQSSWLGHAWRTHQLYSSSNRAGDAELLINQSYSEGAFDAIDRQIYGDPEGLRLAIRFVLSRLHTALSGVMEGSRSIRNGGLGKVIKIEKEVVGFWKVTVRTRGHGKVDGTTTWMILEATGEPLGTLPSALTTAPAPLENTSTSPLRPDWTAFIRKLHLSARLEVPSDTSAQASLPSIPPMGTSEILKELLKTPNDESYPGGIDAGFRKRMEGTEELMVAERTSGTYRTAVDMCDEFNTGQLNPSTKKPIGQANLFLPLSHHVTSAHLTNRSLLSARPTQPLHPSLALIQKEESPESPDIVLKETGQIVGSGEGGGAEGEGVGMVWMGLLGCCGRGFPI
ncbi:hypothetical protein [Phaffia rhodozyma]|uniref:Rho termination factor N-terminal domain-containing protein n=1 Tax=Phaffia rhodozyma TaxID=264483 RepID=A0A0F7SLI1_PHARH|nr:hypothetical protein [Phaffia rhodozyma]